MTDSRKSQKLDASSVLRDKFNISDATVEQYPAYSALGTQGLQICLMYLNALSFTKISEALGVDRRQVTRVLGSAIGKAFLASMQAELVSNTKNRIYKNLDLAMTTLEQILSDKDVCSADRLKAAIFLLDKCIPTVETAKQLELASDPDYQVIDQNRIQLLMDKLQNLMVDGPRGPQGLDPGSQFQIEDMARVRGLITG